jgi:hypothetical protein
MILENPEKYKFLRFEKSHFKNKKYNAVLLNKESGKERKVPFGAIGYEQYKDSTGLNLYSKLNHLDKDRRKRYRERHKGEEKNKFSSGYWSYKYLWT